MANPDKVNLRDDTKASGTTGALGRLWLWIFGDLQTSGARPLPSGIAGTTKLVIQVLWAMLALGLLIELSYGFSLSRTSGFYFVTWAWIASLSAALAGAFFGLLFGLPSLPVNRTLTRIEPLALSNSSSQTAGVAVTDQTSSEREVASGTVPFRALNTQFEQELPYNDSTSLEQIADWLTKIIVGLALTQYRDLADQFSRLSQGLTIRLLGPAANCSLPLVTRPTDLAIYCSHSAMVPGGAIILSFAIIGFLGTYLWMRRYFIIEMVVGKQDAKDVMRARVNAEVQEQWLRASGAEANRLRTELEASQTRAAIIASAATQLEEERLRASDAERKRLESELAAAHAREVRADEAIREARSMGNAQEEISNAAALASLDGLPLSILDSASGLVPEKSPAAAAIAEIRTAVQIAVNPDDPWQGRFGGSPVGLGVQLLASVNPIEGSQFFELALEVKADLPERAAELAGTSAVYFLHPTFGDRPRSVSFGSDGRAPLQLFAYGAFTVGVLLQDGTRLELNLATISGVPDLFRSR